MTSSHFNNVCLLFALLTHALGAILFMALIWNHIAPTHGPDPFLYSQAYIGVRIIAFVASASVTTALLVYKATQRAKECTRCLDVSEELQRHLSALFECTDHSPFVRVSTPFTYPNGLRINLFLLEQEESIQISDLGETVRWLSIRKFVRKPITSIFSPRQREIIDRVCRNRGISFKEGHLVNSGLAPEEVPEALTRLIQGCLQIADISYLFSRARTEGSQ